MAVYLPNTGILETSGRVFGLDYQFLADAGIMAIAMLVLFTLLSYLLFNPVRDFLKKRQEFIESNINDALKDKEEAQKLKSEYNNKLVNVEKEADEILSASRKKALKREIMEELDTEIAIGKLIDTIEYDYPTFHLSMDCFWCEIIKGNLVLKEHEAAKWLGKDELDSVEWLPADVKLIEAIRKALN